MRLPEFPSNQKDLNLYYINLSNLLEFLKQDFFTGCVKIFSPDAQYLVFYEHGNILVIFKKIEDKGSCEKIEQEELNNLKEGKINIYPLDEDKVFFWANIFNAKVLYPNLSSEFTNFVKLINKLKKERLTGYLEIFCQNNDKCWVYFIDGSIIGACCSWHGWNFEPKEKIFSEVTDKATNSTFNVYAISLENFNEPPVSLKAVLEFFEKVFSLIVKKLGEKEFSLIWRQIAMDLSEKYPFLDPFANQFEYTNKKIIIRGRVSEQELIEGLKELSKGILAQKRIEAQVKDKLFSVEKYINVAKALKF